MEAALCVRVRPVVDALLAHALCKLAHHSRVGMLIALTSSNLRRQLVEDRLAGLLDRGWRAGRAVRKVRLTLIVDGGVGEIGHAVLAGALSQPVPGGRSRVVQARRLSVLTTAGEQKPGADDGH